MAEFKTPTTKKSRSRVTENPELQTPIKIPASPFLERIGYGCGVHVLTFERSPKIGFARSPWAIKKRNTRITKDPKYCERIRLEAEILRKLKHPNIVGFRAFTEATNGEPCLAMEKLDISLGDVIEQRLQSGDQSFPADTILMVANEIVKGLEYLHHTVHILHGDVKSYNVLVSQDCRTVKLCDFGVSVPLTELLELNTSTGNFVYIGTECWSAPEIIHEDGPVTNKADMWAYGLVIWEMIALTPPHTEEFQDDSDESLLDNSISEISMACNKENHDLQVSLDEEVTFFKKIPGCKYGTRPALPAIDFGQEYQKVLELFFACTTVNYERRPSAKGVVMFFKDYVYQNVPERLTKHSTGK
ncbi:hypothetical protein KM043_018556 [Ampulex compressa]|nr:hypothetical protein KM043_018556 [Ampulex compressa]